mmetsp:Transcript_85443/g.151375  ORF Transcript_85443/g.151375 Transcript_85443/m.151375 type:complete len:438 (-) Transcript_85443:128-1441(-)
MWWLTAPPGKTSKGHKAKETPRVPKWSSTTVVASKRQPLQLDRDIEEHRLALKNRPRTAPGGVGGRSDWQFRTKVSRPSSAPALFRERTHKDGFLSRIEDNVVQTKIEQLRREQLVQKEIVSNVDVLSDSSLSDLLLMHNKSQRANSCSGPRRARRRVRSHQECAMPVGGITPYRKAKVVGAEPLKSKSSPYTKSVRDLCTTLDRSIEYHSFNFGWPDGPRRRPSDCIVAKSVASMLRGMSRSSLRAIDGEAEDVEAQLTAVTDEEARSKASALDEAWQREARLQEKMASMEEEADKQAQHADNVSEEADKESSESLRSSKSESLRSFKGKAEFLDRPLIDPLRCPLATGEFLTALVRLLVSACGTLQAALQSMDSKQRGRLSRAEWQRALENLGFPTENVPQSWKLLAQHEGEVFLENMEALLLPYLNCKRATSEA